MMAEKRKKTKIIKIGSLYIGGNTPIRIQSMCSTKTSDLKSTLRQIRRLIQAKCEIIRIGISDKESVKSLQKIKKIFPFIPFVADIHFDHRLAILSSEFADKIRINPSNIGGKEKIKEIVKVCKQRQIPIRIGINSGSIEKNIYVKFGATPEGMVESALRTIYFLEDLDFTDIVVSLKSTDVLSTVYANRLFSKKGNYPLHLGVSEAGTLLSGGVKNTSALAILLSEGIGNTLRVSLAEDPVKEVEIGYEILKSLNLRKEGIELIICPSCSRSHFDVITMGKKIEKRLKNLKKQMRVSVMGCEVNGPGEALRSDAGVVGIKDGVRIYIKGIFLKKVAIKDIVDEICRICENF